MISRSLITNWRRVNPICPVFLHKHVVSHLHIAPFHGPHPSSRGYRSRPGATPLPTHVPYIDVFSIRAPPIIAASRALAPHTIPPSPRRCVVLLDDNHVAAVAQHASRRRRRPTAHAPVPGAGSRPRPRLELLDDNLVFALDPDGDRPLPLPANLDLLLPRGVPAAPMVPTRRPVRSRVPGYHGLCPTTDRPFLYHPRPLADVYAPVYEGEKQQEPGHRAEHYASDGPRVRADRRVPVTLGHCVRTYEGAGPEGSRALGCTYRVALAWRLDWEEGACWRAIGRREEGRHGVARINCFSLKLKWRVLSFVNSMQGRARCGLCGYRQNSGCDTMGPPISEDESAWNGDDDDGQGRERCCFRRTRAIASDLGGDLDILRCTA